MDSEPTYNVRPLTNCWEHPETAEPPAKPRPDYGGPIAPLADPWGNDYGIDRTPGATLGRGNGPVGNSGRRCIYAPTPAEPVSNAADDFYQPPVDYRTGVRPLHVRIR